MHPDAKGRIERELFLRSFMALQPNQQVTSQLTSLMRDEHFDTGEIIYTRGSPATSLHFVVVGQVELSRQGTDTWVLEDESIIGILDASRGRPHSRTATAARPTHTISLLFTDYLEVMEDNFEFALRVIKGGTIRSHELAIGLGAAAFEHLCTPTTPRLPAAQVPGDLDIAARLMALHSTPMFAEAPIQALATIAQLATVQVHEPGAQLCKRGSHATQLLLLVDGLARLRCADYGVDTIVTPIRVLGGPAAFGYDECFFDVHAESTTTTLCIDKEDLLDAMEDHFGLLRSFFALISMQRERLMQVKHAGKSVPPSVQRVTVD